MCGPTDQPLHVVIAGAGPSGLLLANLLLKHPHYRVTLVESRSDLGALSVDELRKFHRSWMIGLAGHGLQALREIPELYKEYVKQPHVGVKLQGVSIFIGDKEMKGSVGDEGEDTEGYVVDRNFIVAVLAKYLNDTHSSNRNLTLLYETQVQYVDTANQRILLRFSQGKEEYLPYDLLVGADGSRSVVREALLRDNYEFAMDFGDIFNEFRAVHVAKPEVLSPATMSLLPNIFPAMNGIALPMPCNMINLSIGTTRNNFDQVPAELKSTDPAVVAAYVRVNLKCFTLQDADDFARQWVAHGRWNRTAMVHCNMYHCTKARIVIMGDAAHATSPSIGMGMNTALRDAQALHRLLQQHKNDLVAVLPAFSEERVKEGNSLTDLAFHLYALDTTQQMWETAHMVLRSMLAKYFSWVTPHPQMMIGNPKYDLSDVYTVATNQVKVIPKHRVSNDRIRQEYFEKKVGMVPTDIKPSLISSPGSIFAVATVGALGAAAYFYAVQRI